MAVDTRNKRSSAINVGLPWRGQWPTPDGAIGAQDRSEILGLYDGISFVATTSGTLDATEGADVAALAGNIPVSGSLSATEGADTDATTGNVIVTGTMAVTEGADVASLTGRVVVTGTLSGIEGADAAAFTGTVTVTGLLAVTEGADSFASIGTVLVSGTLSVTEGADTDASTGSVIVSGILSVTEGADTAFFNNFVESTGTLAATEGADTAALRSSFPFPRIRQDAEPVYLLEVQVYNLDAGQLEVKYLSDVTICTKPTDTPANTEYMGRIISADTISRAMFENGGTIGKAQTNSGFFELNNGDRALDAWLDYRIGGWPFTLKYLADKDDPVSTAVTVFIGTMRGFGSKDARTTLQIRTRDKLETLDRIFLTQHYAGTTNSTGATAEGDTNMANQFKPYALGSPFQTPAPPANSPDKIYQASIKNQASLGVKDGGALLTAAGPANYSSLSALQAATTGISGSGAAIEAGEYATCLSDSGGGGAYFRLGALAAKTVTVDQISSSTEADMSAGAIAKQILLDSGVDAGDIDDASFDALTSSSSHWRVGFYVADDSKVIDLVCGVLNDVGATLISTPAGKFKAVSLGIVPDSVFPDPIFTDDTSVDTFTRDDLIDSAFMLQASPQAEGDGVRAYVTNIKYIKKELVLSAGDLVTGLSPAVVNFAGQEYQSTLDGSLTIQAQEPLAQWLDFVTRIATGTGGLIQAQRRFDYYGKRRDFVTFSVSVIRGADRDLGDIITLQPTDGDGNPEFGYGPDGKKMCIIGKTITFGSPKIDLIAWG